MSATEWVPVDSDRLTTDLTYGPPCPGPESHSWTLTIDGGDILYGSGCEECDRAVDVDYLAVDLTGRLTFEADHPNLGGWHGDTRCDCNWWWRFVPDAPAVTPEGQA